MGSPSSPPLCCMSYDPIVSYVCDATGCDAPTFADDLVALIHPPAQLSLVMLVLLTRYSSLQLRRFEVRDSFSTLSCVSSLLPLLRPYAVYYTHTKLCPRRRTRTASEACTFPSTVTSTRHLTTKCPTLSINKCVRGVCVVCVACVWCVLRVVCVRVR